VHSTDTHHCCCCCCWPYLTAAVWCVCCCVHRDFAIVPFYGNSIATRVPAITLTGSNSSSSSSSSSTSCWPSFFRSSGSSSSSSKGSSSSRAAAAAADILVLGDFRAAQRVCLRLKLSPAAAEQQQQQQCSRQQLEELIRQQMDEAGEGSIQQQQQQQRDVVDVWLVNTHLDHASPEIRARQMQVCVCVGGGGGGRVERRKGVVCGVKRRGVGSKESSKGQRAQEGVSARCQPRGRTNC